MRKELLVNAAPPETRVALTEDGRVVEVLHERRGRQGLVGNVYLGRVHRVLPGMQAAFVSIGLERDAFLYVEDAAAAASEFDFGDDETEADDDAHADRARIDDLVKEGQEIVVQVRKDPLGAKGPRVTSAISLPGRNLVFLPNGREIGVSRRLTDDAERERLRGILQAMSSEGGFIARTAAAGKSAGELEPDRAYLTGLAARIQKRRESAAPPTLLHRELDLALRSVRDLVVDDLDAIRVDDAATRDRIVEFLDSVAPSLARRVEIYDDTMPLFERFGVEAEIENALRSRVALPSGGSIVIHQTEALVAIDVNTGRYVGREDLEQTVFAANMEAAPEIARQIRLRDLGGLLVVDFIDMEDPEHRRRLFEAFEAELSRDRSRTRAAQISEFGLVEITRQRSRGNLERVLTRSCPCCAGAGRVKTDLTAALDLRRALLAPPSLFRPGETVRVRVRPGVARVLAEEDVLADAERTLGIHVEHVEDPALREKNFEIERE
ncbi:MAG TPA: Rne/Rng family ribonuclease [Thermoanaerobaculia bacterium]|nr:Rne/Rng family ribonuclease [Thermoanaerobaculia bacterium]